MSALVQDIIDRLQLQPHPEGGFYREIYRSGTIVSIPECGPRVAMTCIYFLVTADSPSTWHRLRFEETWSHLSGSPLDLFSVPEDLSKLSVERLGPAEGETGEPLRVVPARAWQAAQTTGEYSLVACSVAPGFEFEDFTLLRDDRDRAQTFLSQFPETRPLLGGEVAR